MGIFATYEAAEFKKPFINYNIDFPREEITLITKIDDNKVKKNNKSLDTLSNYYVETPKKSTNGLFLNGDTVEINSSKSKYGHTATYYNGKWYSDFALINMNPYNDPNAKIRIFRNPNAKEAEELARRIALTALKKSIGKCAQYVRLGLGYKAEGHNGGNFGELLLKHGWALVGRKGMKFDSGGSFATYTPLKLDYEYPIYDFINPYLRNMTFTTYVDPSSVKSVSKSNNILDDYLLSTPTSTASKSTNIFVKYLTDKGLSDIAARGIVGNIMLESNGNIKALSKDGHNSIGLAQWTGPRRVALEKMYGKNSTWQNQLDFMLHELNTTHKKAYNALANAETVEEATEGFMKHYEKPNKKYANLNKRIQYAKNLG